MYSSFCFKQCAVYENYTLSLSNNLESDRV
jgi:hypothetical protein